jgi:hypothetical protein
MVRRGKRPSKGVANKSHTSVVPLSPEERSVLDKVSACPIVRVPIQRLRPSCPFRKLYPDVLMMQSGQDGNGYNDTRPLDCSMQGRIFL